MSLKTRVQEKATAWYRRHEKWIPLEFFLAGFIFDVVTLDRIDSLFTWGLQITYIVLTGILISLEILERAEKWKPPAKLESLWKYSEHLTHFWLGSLFSSYTLFYFKSSSVVASSAFLIFLLGVLLANEFVKFGGMGTMIRVALWSLSLFSFTVATTPILLGFIGTLPFILALIFSGFAALPFYFWLSKKLPDLPRLVQKQIRIPFLSVQVFFAAAYFLQIIPPAPLAIQQIGIYRAVAKVDGKYELTNARPWWKIWEKGEQDFLARPGDKVICFAQIFSPSGFKDSLYVRWLYHDPRAGWLEADRIPFEIVGGSNEGYRGYTVKSNWQAGTYKVKFETSDGRELGRISVNVVAATPETILPPLSVDRF